ncbi:hypothetical protein M9458_054812 [Cirrhinus mrigala]|uniref:Uncharacterized protein n=1 Tax=Cirrhinus mrigala TaxID=683832 RepID=A0ABD0MMW3_CIRMR
MCKLKFDVVAFVRVHDLQCFKASAPYCGSYRTVAHCGKSQISLITRRGAFSMSTLGVEPVLYLQCLHKRGADGKNDANIEETMPNGGFGFQVK